MYQGRGTLAAPPKHPPRHAQPPPITATELIYLAGLHTSILDGLEGGVVRPHQVLLRSVKLFRISPTGKSEFQAICGSRWR